MTYILYGDADAFFGKYLKNKELPANATVLVLSNDVKASSSVTSNKSGRTTQVSKFKNIYFADSIKLSGWVEETFYGSSTKTFIDTYKSSLRLEDATYELCCLVDLVLNKNRNVFVITSYREMKTDFLEYLREFLEETFQITMHPIGWFLENEKDPVCYEDKEKALALLDYWVDKLKKDDKSIIEEFVNDFDGTEYNAQYYKDYLESKSVEELVEIGVKLNTFVNRRKPKEFIIDHLLKIIMKGKVS